MAEGQNVGGVSVVFDAESGDVTLTVQNIERMLEGLGSKAAAASRRVASSLENITKTGERAQQSALRQEELREKGRVQRSIIRTKQQSQTARDIARQTLANTQAGVAADNASTARTIQRSRARIASAKQTADVEKTQIKATAAVDIANTKARTTAAQIASRQIVNLAQTTAKQQIAASGQATAAQIANIRAVGQANVAQTRANATIQSAQIRAQTAANTLAFRQAREDARAQRGQGPQGILGVAGSFISNITTQLRNVLSVAFAFQIIRGVAAIEQSFAAVIRSALEFSREMQSAEIATAAILTSTREMRTASGALVAPSEAFALNLAKARDLQQELLLLDATTLGTLNDLVKAQQLVFAFTADQKATDQERLELTQKLVNATSLIGQTGVQQATEIRQILLGERDQGQLVLPQVGLRAADVRGFRAAGTNVQRLNLAFEGLNTIALRINASFDGLISTTQTWFRLLGQTTFGDFFTQGQLFLRGFNNELTKTIEQGGLDQFLGLTSGSAERFGQTIAQLTIDFVSGIAEMTTKLATFSVENEGFFKGIAAAGGLAIETLSGLGKIGFGAGAELLAVSDDIVQGIINPSKFAQRELALTTRLALELADAIRDPIQGSRTIFDAIRDAEGLGQILRDAAGGADTLRGATSSLVAELTVAAGSGTIAGILTKTFLSGTAFGPQAGLLVGVLTTIGILYNTISENIKKVSANRDPWRLRQLEAFQSVAKEVADDIKRIGDELRAVGGLSPESISRLVEMRETLADMREEVGTLPPSEMSTALRRTFRLEKLIAEISDGIREAKDETGDMNDELEKAIALAARFAEEAARIRATFMQDVARRTSDPLLFAQVGAAEIDAQRQRDLLQAKGNADTLRSIEEIAHLRTAQLSLDTNDLQMRLMQERVDATIQGLDAISLREETVAEAALATAERQRDAVALALDINERRGAGLDVLIAGEQALGMASAAVSHAEVIALEVRRKGLADAIHTNRTLIGILETQARTHAQVAASADPVFGAGAQAAMIDTQKNIAAVTNTLIEQEAAYARLGIEIKDVHADARNTAIQTAETVRELSRGPFQIVADDLAQSSRDLSQTIANNMLRAVDAIGDAFTDMVFDAKFDLSSLVNVARQVHAEITKALVVRPLVGALLGGFGVQPTPNVSVPTFARGGTVGKTSTPKTFVDPRIFQEAAKMQMGGFVQDRNAIPIIAHRGEMVIPANTVQAVMKSGPVIPPTHPATSTESSPPRIVQLTARPPGNTFEEFIGQDDVIPLLEKIRKNTEETRMAVQDMDKTLQKQLAVSAFTGGLSLLSSLGGLVGGQSKDTTASILTTILGGTGVSSNTMDAARTAGATSANIPNTFGSIGNPGGTFGAQVPIIPPAGFGSSPGIFGAGGSIGSLFGGGGLFGKGLSPGGGVGDFFSSISSLFSSIFSIFSFFQGGGIVGKGMQPQREVNTRVFENAPRLQKGGLIGGEIPIIAHRGEVVMPLDKLTGDDFASRGTKNTAQPRGPMSVVFNIQTPDPGSFRRSRTHITQDMVVTANAFTRK